MAASSTEHETSDHEGECDGSVGANQNHEDGVLEGTCVEVYSVGFLQLSLPREVDEREWEEEEDEGAADASGVGEEGLGVFVEADDEDDGDGDQDRPNALHHSQVVLSHIPCHFVVTSRQPFLDGDDFHEVVPEGNGDDWH